MARLHLFELEDQPWFPSVLRDAGTAYLRKAAAVTGQPGYIAPVRARHLRACRTNRLIDLCSGGGGPIPELLQALEHEGVEATAVLTDLYPSSDVLAHIANESAGRIEVCRDPVDARRVPSKLVGCLSLFNAVHHFRPDDARAILQSAAESGHPIATVETIDRSLPFFLGIFFAPIASLFIIPFLRPFRWSWLLFTYVIPLIPLFILWDGFVSGLRVHSAPELERLTKGLGGDAYVWEIGRLAMGRQPVSGTYLLGRPGSD